MIAGIGAIVFNRFAAEETFRAIPPLLRPWTQSLRVARICVVVWGIIIVFLGLVVIANAWASHHPFGLTSI